MINWLVHTFIPKFENAAIYTLSAGLVTTIILTPFRAAIKKIWRALDSIDPDTDTGVTKELKNIERHLAHAPLDNDSDQHVPPSQRAR